MLAVFLAVFYAAAWLAFDSLERVQTLLLASGGRTYAALVGKPMSMATEATTIRFRILSQPKVEGWLDAAGVQANTAFLFALLVASPGMRISRRLTSLAAGMAMLYVSHVLFLATKIEITLLEVKHPLGGNATIWRFLDDFFEITGKGFFPILIWFALAMPYLTGRIDRRTSVGGLTAVGRNAPCPCGSGKKYKLCCLPRRV